MTRERFLGVLGDSPMPGQFWDGSRTPAKSILTTGNRLNHIINFYLGFMDACSIKFSNQTWHLNQERLVTILLLSRYLTFDKPFHFTFWISPTLTQRLHSWSPSRLLKLLLVLCFFKNTSFFHHLTTKTFKYPRSMRPQSNTIQASPDHSCKVCK